MTKKELADKIAINMLEYGMLDECNYNDDILALLEDARNIILKYFEDYIIISGTILD